MMEIEGRGSAKCQKSKSEDMIDMIEFDLNDNKTKQRIVLSPTFKPKTKT